MRFQMTPNSLRQYYFSQQNCVQFVLNLLILKFAVLEANYVGLSSNFQRQQEKRRYIASSTKVTKLKVGKYNGNILNNKSIIFKVSIFLNEIAGLICLLGVLGFSLENPPSPFSTNSQCVCVAIVSQCLDLSSHGVGQETSVYPLGPA